MSAGLAVAAGVSPLDAIDRAPLAHSTRAQYKRALGRFLATGRSLADVDALFSYAAELPRSERAFLKASMRLYCRGVATALKGQAVPENVNQVTAALYRLEALQDAVQVKRGAGVKAHTWLSQAEVKRLLDACQNGIAGQRDRLVMGLLVAAGLRRQEVADLRFEDVRLQPVGERIRTVLAVRGKGGKERVVPISDALANAIDDWGQVVGARGYVARALGMKREPGQRLSSQAIYELVKKRGVMIGKPALAPHDLRRTYAQLGYEAGVPLVQISKLLGHASVETTQRYLNLDLDLESTVSDFVPF